MELQATFAMIGHERFRGALLVAGGTFRGCDNALNIQRRRCQRSTEIWSDGNRSLYNGGRAHRRRRGRLTRANTLLRWFLRRWNDGGRGRYRDIHGFQLTQLWRGIGWMFIERG